MSEYSESFPHSNQSQTPPPPEQQNEKRPYSSRGADSYGHSPNSTRTSTRTSNINRNDYDDSNNGHYRGNRYHRGGYHNNNNYNYNHNNYGGSNHYSGYGNNSRGNFKARGNSWTPRGGGRGNFQNHSRRFNNGGASRSSRDADDSDVPMVEQIQESDTQGQDPGHGQFDLPKRSGAGALNAPAPAPAPAPASDAAYTRRNVGDDSSRRSPSPYAARNGTDGDGSYTNNDYNSNDSYYGNREGSGRDGNSYVPRGSRGARGYGRRGRGGYSNYGNFNGNRGSGGPQQQQQQRRYHHRSSEPRVELDKSFWQNEMPDVVVPDEECEKINYFEILPGSQQEQQGPTTGKQQQPQKHIDVVEKRALAFYSRDENLQRYYNSTASLRYYNRPRGTRSKTTNRPIYNLLENWQSYKPFVYDRAVPRLTGTLWVLSQFEANQRSQKNEAGVPPVKVDFVSNKGPLVKLMSLASQAIASSKYVNLDLNIATVGNMIMMSNNDYREVETAKDLQNAFVGHKFESVITSEKHPSEIEDWKALQRERFNCPLTNNENFKILAHVVIKDVGAEAEANAEADSHSIIMSSEMDCCLAKNNDPYDLSNYAEIKTHFSASRGEAFEKKLYLAYLQSFFTGMSKVIIGFRDSSGYLLGIKEFQVDEIPSLINQERFNIAESKSFLHRVLGWIKSNVEFGMEGKAVWRLSLDHESKRLVLRKISNDKYVEQITRFVYPKSFAQHRKEHSEEIFGENDNGNEEQEKDEDFMVNDA